MRGWYVACKVVSLVSLLMALLKFFRGDRDGGMAFMVMAALWQGFAAEVRR